MDTKQLGGKGEDEREKNVKGDEMVGMQAFWQLCSNSPTLQPCWRAGRKPLLQKAKSLSSRCELQALARPQRFHHKISDIYVRNRKRGVGGGGEPASYYLHSSCLQCCMHFRERWILGQFRQNQLEILDKCNLSHGPTIYYMVIMTTPSLLSGCTYNTL